MRQLRVRLLWSVHILLWVALAIAAYLTAGPYKFANCWQLIPIYIAPLGWLLIALAGFGLIVVPAAAFLTSFRQSRYFAASCHVTIFTLGWIACQLAAYMSAGQVSCL
ncbi:hypothetical protein [Rhizobium sp. Rhizsp82]|uniref:hypothetical protein n=1 Tax=Rhizobium sp. Rhizsp82 TaxID=3243057 RepID=UPI0039B54029